MVFLVFRLQAMKLAMVVTQVVLLSFVFLPSKSGVAASTPSTKVAIALSGGNTFIGYGALQKSYEILSIDATSMYLRVQGTETGNAWYLKLKQTNTTVKRILFSHIEAVTISTGQQMSCALFI